MLYFPKAVKIILAISITRVFTNINNSLWMNG